MKFDELPENWTCLPLDDAPLSAGVIDLILGHADRVRNSMLVLPCDEHDVGLPAPLGVGETDWSESYAERRRGLAVLPQLPAAAFLVAVSSRYRLPDRMVRGSLRPLRTCSTTPVRHSSRSGWRISTASRLSAAARNGSLGAMTG
ncbi:hypothetical protein [Dietzia cercidiphylli]|uniref:hypothetical protein n=1 Tax=Dietzia cercidiphylli TaxID=498199 RepID=UPI00223A98C1|nr:hypothetical protein [Dietzia cercidiphylli]MCT1514360.1 hypothetical protein [Dietzia cercidiphylli]